jgi:hypothetical protein
MQSWGKDIFKPITGNGSLNAHSNDNDDKSGKLQHITKCSS